MTPVWVADELLWNFDAGPRGWWEGVALAGAVAASTSRIGVGTWVLSALHRNPALTANVVETLDEISGGRLLFGLGSGHARAQGEAFGFPLDQHDAEAIGFGVPITGPAEEIASALRRLGEMGVTRVELVLVPPTPAGLEAVAPVLALLDAHGP